MRVAVATLIFCCLPIEHKKAAHVMSRFIFSHVTDYSGSVIASEGQTPAHVPHSVQASASIE